MEGVFRKNGNIRQLKKLADTIDQSPVTSIDQLLENENGVQLAALLKRYLRELPEPLLTWSLYKVFMHCGRQTHRLHLACCLLPKPNRDTMMALFCCLKWLSTTWSDQNKMDIPNLARVIAPSVLYDHRRGGKDAYLVAAQQEEIRIIEILIQDIENLSQVRTLYKKGRAHLTQFARLGTL